MPSRAATGSLLSAARDPSNPHRPPCQPLLDQGESGPDPLAWWPRVAGRSTPARPLAQRRRVACRPMTALLGIDLGTSAVKAVVVDEAGHVLGTGTREIPMEVPAPGRAEQDPERWWSETVTAVRAALDVAGVRDLAGIGMDG